MRVITFGAGTDVRIINTSYEGKIISFIFYPVMVKGVKIYMKVVRDYYIGNA